MRKLKKFLKLRKQNDMVKIILIFFILGCFMLGSAIYEGISIYSELHKPVEYILEADLTKGSSEIIKNLLEIDGLKYAGIQKENDLTVNISGNGEQIECCCISKEYFKEVYQIKDSSGMKTFYLSLKVYNEIIEKMEDVKKQKEKEFQAEYQLGEEERGIAKFVRMDNKLLSGKKIALQCGKTVDFVKGNCKVRVFITKMDFSGSMEKQIEDCGVTIQNVNIIRDREYLVNSKLLKIKYHIVIGVLCSAVIILFWFLWRKQNNN
mgnify:CR=1 FL=1